jgi:hypothetical protein
MCGGVLNPMTRSIKESRGDFRHQWEGHVKAEKETGLLQAKECQGFQKKPMPSREAWDGLRQSLQQEHTAESLDPPAMIYIFNFYCSWYFLIAF